MGPCCNPARTIVPISVAVSGVIVPALLFTLVNISVGLEVPKGGAIAINAAYYPGEMHFEFLALAVLPLLALIWLVQKCIRAWYLLGFAVHVIRSAKRGGPEAGPGISGLKSAFADTVGIGIVPVLVVGTFMGVFGSTWLVTKTTKAELDAGLAWIDVIGIPLLAGVGFTVSL